MKHISAKRLLISAAAAVAITLGLTAYFILSARGKPVTLSDQGLQSMLLLGLNRQNGQLYESDLNHMQRLVIVSDQIVQINGKDDVTENAQGCSFKGQEYRGKGKISSLKDLPRFKNLTELTIVENQIAELPDISAAKLKVLNLSHNSVATVGHFSKASSLRSLDLSYNLLKDLSALKACNELEKLDCSFNQVHDLSPLSGLARVKTVDLSGNIVSDIFPLAKLDSCERLNLSGNRIRDISSLASLRKLQTAVLDRNQISSVESLAKLKSLKQLSVALNQIDAISASFFSLISVNLSNNRLHFIRFSSFPVAQSVNLQFNQLNTVDGIAADAALRFLNVSYNNLHSVNFIKDGSQITDLGLAGNLLLTVEPLGKSCPHLRQLDISNCGLGSIKGLEACKSLQTLCIGGDFLADKTVLNSFSRATVIGLEAVQ